MKPHIPQLVPEAPVLPTGDQDLLEMGLWA